MSDVLAALLMRKAQEESGLTINDPDFPGTLGYYTMGNISGTTLVDETPVGNDVTIPSGVTTVTDEDGSGLQFHAHPEELDMPFTRTITSGTGVEVYFKFTGHNAANDMVLDDEDGSGAAAKSRLALRWRPSVGEWYLNSGNGPTGSIYYIGHFADTLPVDGTMIHLVLVLETDGSLSLYRDGVALTQTATSTNNPGGLPPTPVANAYSPRFGGPKYTYTDRNIKAKAYKLKFFDFAPSPAQVAQLYATRNDID